MAETISKQYAHGGSHSVRSHSFVTGSWLEDIPPLVWKASLALSGVIGVETIEAKKVAKGSSIFETNTQLQPLWL